MPSISSYTRMTKARKLSVAGISAAGAAAVALTVVPGSADAGDNSQSTASKVSAEPTAFSGKNATVPEQRQSIAEQLDVTKQRAQDEAQAKKTETKSQKDKVEAQKQENQEAGEKRSAVADKAAEKKAEEERDAKEDEKSSRGEKRDEADDKKDDKPKYEDNLDGWIKESLDIMEEEGIPGSYEGIKRNIIRESGGDPNVSNDWDINAQNGTPSKGLLQVIKPTFDAYHVEGTPKNMTDPVANIVAACNYAADRYGSMDNVDSAY